MNTVWTKMDYLLDVACPIGRKTEEDGNQKSLYLNDFCTSVVQDSRQMAKREGLQRIVFTIGSPYMMNLFYDLFIQGNLLEFVPIYY